jgi:hypothetical protein
MQDGPKTATSSVRMLVKTWKGDGKDVQGCKNRKERIDGVRYRVICSCLESTDEKCWITLGISCRKRERIEF